MRKPRPATASNPLPRLDQVMLALAAGSAAGLVGCAPEQHVATLVAFEPSGGETVQVVQVVQPQPVTTVVGTTTYVVQQPPPPPEPVFVRRFAQPPPPHRPPPPTPPPPALIGPVEPVPLAGAPMSVGPAPVPVPHPPVRPTTVVPAPRRPPAPQTPPTPELTRGGAPSITLAPVPAAHLRTLAPRRA